VQVIGAGFGRTGTMSLRDALERLLGGRCYHMETVLRRPADIDVWHRAARGHPVDWDALFADHVAAVDWPVAAYVEPLVARYPEAKVVLTVRDPEAWYASVRDTIYRFGQVLRRPPTAWLAAASGRRAGFQAMVDATLWGEGGVFDGRFDDREHALAVYRAHCDAVRAAVPPERLLVFDVREGWEPLCTFLEQPVPDRPFPRTNSSRAMRWRLRALRAAAWAAAPVTGALAGVRGRRR